MVKNKKHISSLLIIGMIFMLFTSVVYADTMYTVTQKLDSFTSSNKIEVSTVPDGTDIIFILKPTKNRVIEEVQLTNGNNKVVLSTLNKSIINSYYEAKTYISNDGRVTLTISKIKDNIEVKPITTIGNINSFIHKGNSDYSLDYYTYKNDCIPSCSVESKCESNYKSNKVCDSPGCQPYNNSVCNAYTQAQSVKTQCVPCGKNNSTTNSSVKFTNVYTPPIPHLDTSHIIRKFSDFYSKINTKGNSPIKHGRIVEIEIESVDSQYGIDYVKLEIGNCEIIIKRNQPKFTFNGKTYKIYWFYKNKEYETLKTAIDVYRDINIRSYTNKLDSLSKFELTERDLERERLSKYINGYNGRFFAPNQQISKAEAIQMMTKLFLKPSSESINAYKNVNKFVDVKATDWYAGAVNMAAAEGYLDVLPHLVMFEPKSSLTRAEMMALVTSFSKQNVDTHQSEISPYLDVPTSHWAYQYIISGTNLGLVEGNIGKFRPNDNLTRAEAVRILNRATGRPLAKNGISIYFEDVKSTDWFYMDVLSATNDMF